MSGETKTRLTEARLLDLVAKAAADYRAMTPEQRKAHDDAQRASFVRGMAPCEHGRVDFETCPECRRLALKEDPAHD